MSIKSFFGICSSSSSSTSTSSPYSKVPLEKPENGSSHTSSIAPMIKPLNDSSHSLKLLVSDHLVTDHLSQEHKDAMENFNIYVERMKGEMPNQLKFTSIPGMATGLVTISWVDFTTTTKYRIRQTATFSGFNWNCESPGTTELLKVFEMIHFKPSDYPLSGWPLKNRLPNAKYIPISVFIMEKQDSKEPWKISGYTRPAIEKPLSKTAVVMIDHLATSGLRLLSTPEVLSPDQKQRLEMAREALASVTIELLSDEKKSSLL